MVGRNHILPVTLIALSFINLGCTTNVKKVVHKTSSKFQPDQVLLVEPKDPARVSLSTLGYDQTSLGFSMHQANMNAAMTSPQYNPAAGVAGALIGGAIVKSMGQARAQKKANKPVADLLKVLDKMDWKVAFSRIKKSYKSPVFVNNLDSKKEKGNTLKLTHSLEVSSNYGSLNLKVLAELISQKQEVLYRNYFHVQSRKLLKDNELLSDLNTKDRLFVDRVISGMLKYIPPLVFSDISRKSRDVKVGEVRFANHMGKYFEMGEVLAANEGYITFRTLRGEVKHYPYTVIE